MKSFISILPVLLLFLLAGCQVATTELPEEDSFADLEQSFENPPKEFSTGPLWVWNDVVTKEKIAGQLKAFRDEHILQVFIHPRPGLITEYLSDEWFELARFTMEKAKELGMNVWIYDENSYPSGFAGGHVQAQMPESYTQGSAIAMHKGSRINTSGKVEYIVVLKKEGDGFDTVNQLPENFTDDYYAFEVLHEQSSGWYGGFSYVDLLIPGVTEKFIELTMTGYEKAMGEEFGKSVPGVFTDEPNIAPRGGLGVKYSPVLFNAFQERWGYDLKLHLPLLYEEVGDYKKVRYHYYRLLLELFIERWSKPWYKYTESKNLKWTGHYWEHGWPSPHHGGDNMAMYAWHQMPGIDMLFNTFSERPDQFGNVRAVKELSSVANQMGRRRTLSETYGGSGWDLNFMDMKRNGDWEYALGVNFMNQHLSHMTLKGRRKGDYPQSFLSHAPYWEDYGVLAKYFARLSLALSRGLQISHTLILEPTTTAWMYYSPTVENEKMVSIEKSFRQLVDDMEKWQLEYDLGAENIIKDHGRIAGKKFCIGDREYDRVVLPPFFENIDEETWNLLQKYVRKGGKVFSFSIPQYINGVPSEEVINLAHENGNWIEIDDIGEPEVFETLQEPGFRVQNPQSIRGKIYHMRRYLADGQLIFWSNYNREGVENIRFDIEGKDVSCLDPFTGERMDFPVQMANGMAQIEFDLPAAGSKLLFVHAMGKSTRPEESSVEKTEDWQNLDTGPLSISATDSNTLTIDYADLKVGKKIFHDLYFAMAADSAYKLNGLEQYARTGHNPWAVAVQYKTNILDMGKNFDESSGFTATYNFEIARDFRPGELKAVVEWAHLYDVAVNGEPVEPLPGKSWLDHSFNVFDISGKVKPGKNQLTLSIQPMHIHAELEPVYLTGDFSLEPQQKGFLITQKKPLEVGAWKDQGMPFYSGSVCYSRDLEVEQGVEYKVKLNEWNGTVARILVNDEKVGIVGWPPYEFDLTSYLQPGTQKVTVEVVGSLQNLLGPHHGNIREGIVTPWNWFNGPLQMPPGEQYYHLEYGLTKDFSILNR
jgi:hypothetical protein